MFESLKSAFSGVAKSFGQRQLKEKDIDAALSGMELDLMRSDVAVEVIGAIKSDLKSKIAGTSVDRHGIEDFVKDSLVGIVSGIFDGARKVDLLGDIEKKKTAGEPYVIVFVGINGTGKTTSLSKLARLLQDSKVSVVVAAADTFRAGAIEQLREHTKNLNLKIVAQNYGADPAAVSRDAVLYARSHKVDCVLVDTAGRMQTSKNLMEQIEKIINVVKPDFIIFVGDALAGNDTVNQAREFYGHTKFGGSILAKSDADAKGGAALSIVKITGSPILYMGVGQRYEDLVPFEKDSFLRAVFGTTGAPAADPFEGISAGDIDSYNAAYGTAPPENDEQTASVIREWIRSGRPAPGGPGKTRKPSSLLGRFGK